MHDAHLGCLFLFLDILAEYTLLSMTVMVTPCLWYVVGMKLVMSYVKFPQGPFARAPFVGPWYWGGGVQNVWGEENVPETAPSRKILDPSKRASGLLIFVQEKQSNDTRGGWKTYRTRWVQNPFLGHSWGFPPPSFFHPPPWRLLIWIGVVPARKNNCNECQVSLEIPWTRLSGFILSCM